MTKKQLILTILALLLFLSSEGQQLPNDRTAIIRSFFKRLLKEKKGALSIAEEFMYLPKVSAEDSLKRNELLVFMQDELLKQFQHKLTAKNIDIVSYKNFLGKKKLFNEYSDNVYIAVVKKQPAVYFCFLDNKILSFQTITKGSISYFIIP